MTKYLMITSVLIIAILAVVLYKEFFSEKEDFIRMPEEFDKSKAIKTIAPCNLPYKHQEFYMHKAGEQYKDMLNKEDIVYDIVDNKGKYCFKVPELKYDGIYCAKTYVKDDDIVGRKWILNKGQECYPKKKYCGDKYFFTPKRKFVDGAPNELQFPLYNAEEVLRTAIYKEEEYCKPGLENKDITKQFK